MAQISLRSKALKSGRFSLYLDYNEPHTRIEKNGKVRTVRRLEYLGIYLTKDYTTREKQNSKPLHPKIAPKDKEGWQIAHHILAKRRYEYHLEDKKQIQDLRPKGDFISFFENEILNNTSKNNSSYRGALYHLRSYAGQEISFDELHLPFLEGFKNYLLGKVKPNTTNIYLDRLRIILNKALRLKIISENPMRELERPKPMPIARVHLLNHEIDKLLQHQEDIDPEVIRAFLFSCYSSLRYSDLSTLTWENIRQEQYHCQKTGKIEELILPEAAHKLLDAQKTAGSSTQEVFHLRNLSYYNRQLRKWAAQAGIAKKLSSHVGRRTCANLLRRLGVDTFLIRDQLGHANSNMTEKAYLQSHKEERKAAVDRLPDFTNPIS